MYHSRRLFGKARPLYAKLLKISPDNSKASYNLGRLEHECGNFEAARVLYRKALRSKCSDNTRCNILAYLGLLEQDAFGDFKAACECYGQSLAACPRHVPTLDNQCALLSLTNNPDDARDLHAIVCQLDPSHM
jgi:tetratricopeptide (TPR) repeat protein